MGSLEFCEAIHPLLITDDFTEISTLATFNYFIRVNKDMTLLGAPVLKSKAQGKAIQDKIDDLTRAVERLKHLQAMTLW